MSIKSKEVKAELLKKGDPDYYGKSQMVKDKDIYISFFDKTQTVVDSNGLVRTVNILIGLTDTKNINTENQVKIDTNIYNIDSVNTNGRKTVLTLKEV